MVWISVLFFRFGKFLAVSLSTTFSAVFSLTSPCGTSVMQMLVHFVLSKKSLKLFSLLKFCFPFCFSHCVISIILSSGSLICSSIWLLLIPSSVLFISVIIYIYIFTLTGLLIFFSSLLNFSLCSSISFSSSVAGRCGLGLVRRIGLLLWIRSSAYPWKGEGDSHCR